jgi:hypothetical protein
MLSLNYWMFVSDDIMLYMFLGMLWWVCCYRGSGDLLRQLHAVAEAESKLSVHQSRLSAIEAKVVPEHLFFHNDMETYI